MKKNKKAIAMLLASAMVMPFTSFTVFADAADITGITIAGTTVAMANIVDTTGKTDVTELGDITVNIPLTSANAKVDASTLVTITETASGDALVTHYVGGASEGTTIAAVTATDGQVLASELGTGTKFKVGDVLWISDGLTQVARFVFVTPDNGAIEGEAGIKNPVYNVTVPTTLPHSINTLQIGSTVIENGQVTSGTFAFANASNVPVRVTVNLDASTSAAIAGLKDSTWVPTDKIDGADKHMKLALIGAVAAGAAPTLADPANGTPSYTQSDTVKTIRWFDTETKKASIDFLLAAGTGTDLNATAKNGVGIFQIYGQMETYAQWAAGDIKITGTYKLQGIKTTDYVAPFIAGTGDDLATVGNTEAVDAPFLAWNGGIPAKGATATRATATELVGLNVMPVAGSAVTLGFLTGTGMSSINNTAKTATYTYSGNVTASTIIPFAFDGKTISEVQYNSGVLTGWTTQATGGIKLESAKWDPLAANTYVLGIKLSDNTVWTVSVVKQ